jgi:hypothetical protein
MAWSDLVAAIRDCDLLIDVGGMCWLEERWLARRRVLIDCDPLFTQVDSFASDILDEYDLRFSYGTNLGSPDCRVPRRGLDWIPSLPPVVVDLWASPDPRPGAGFRTVANWTSYGGITHDGVWYGQKDTEFTRVLDLPVAAPATLEIALSGADDDVRQTFRAAGWRVRDGGEVTRTMDDYRDYIAGSIGEFSVAKHAYVSSHSGWFSERTVCFLAAGRPAVVQDTGFTRWLPGDRGIVAFSDRDGAVAGLHAVVADPAGHAAAARELAARYFDHRVVLTRLLDTALALPRARVGAS